MDRGTTDRTPPLDTDDDADSLEMRAADHTTLHHHDCANNEDEQQPDGTRDDGTTAAGASETGAAGTLGVTAKDDATR
eukprot:2396506-Heterocapsa_arctica.AAC.1